jgi:hypothetical protein
VNEWKMIFQTNGNLNKAGLGILISDRFGDKNCNRKQEVHYIMTKG